MTSFSLQRPKTADSALRKDFVVEQRPGPYYIKFYSDLSGVQSSDPPLPAPQLFEKINGL